MESTSSLSLDSRIGILRRRRRNSILRQVFVVTGPVLAAISLVALLAGGEVIASAR